MHRTLQILTMLTSWAFVYPQVFAIEAVPPEVVAQALVPTATLALTQIPPWSFKNVDQYQGMAVDYLRDIARDVRLPIIEVEIPLGRMPYIMTRGKPDIFFARSPEVPFDCCVSLGKVFAEQTVVRGRKTGPVWDIGNRQGLEICRTGLSGYDQPGFRMYDAGSLDVCVRMVASNRLPFLIGERYVVREVLRSSGPVISSLFGLSIVVATRPVHFYISHALNKSSFGPAMRKAVAERKMLEYINRYSGLKKSP
ncbi:MAG TPA: hypothetical protein VE954_29020 [Oligoflexus sp.]|uniref:hypothetical protein n=1 Tax=Oligoflexus sp. TaxID=1971216 RepID=UPI002D59BF33|nr:hypothetical protein [Oligoflexus sp.]HYX37164.1 hypothetical protein [Oligoflexus sp.]